MAHNTNTVRVLTSARSLRLSLGRALELAHQVITVNVPDSTKREVVLARRFLDIIEPSMGRYDHAESRFPTITPIVTRRSREKEDSLDGGDYAALDTYPWEPDDNQSDE